MNTQLMTDLQGNEGLVERLCESLLVWVDILGMDYPSAAKVMADAADALAAAPHVAPQTKTQIEHAIDHFEPPFIADLANERETWIADNMRHEILTMVRSLLPHVAGGQEGAPDGWQLVPIEPTEEMAAAVLERTWLGEEPLDVTWEMVAEVLRVMLSAAPRPAPVTGGEPHPLSEWNEDVGDALWWKLPITEPPYVGTPNDLGMTVEVYIRHYVGGGGEIKTTKTSTNVGGWPGYHTHWTPLVVPAAIRALPAGGGGAVPSQDGTKP